MSLPWVRLESDIASHDKILALLSDPSAKRWQAAFSYTCALGWSGAHETDGRIPKVALPYVHGTPATARLLVKYRLWEETLTGWEIRNFADRQTTKRVAEAVRDAKRAGAEKGNCRRWHGETCWKNGRCSREVA